MARGRENDLVRPRFYIANIQRSRTEIARPLRFRTVETPIALRYPNERIHETVLDRQLKAGDRFDMYGRTWTAVGTKQGRRQGNTIRRIVCVPVE